MSFHRLDQVRLFNSGFEVQFGIQSIYFEEVPVGFPRRGHRAAISYMAEIVPALPCSAQHFFLGIDRLGEFPRFRGEVKQYPVYPYPGRRVGIV